MGVYSAWLQAQHPELFQSSFTYRALASVPWAHPTPDSVDPSRVVLLSDFEPPESLMYQWLGGLPQHVLLPFTPTQPLPNVSYSQVRVDINPMIWEPAFPASCDVMAVLVPWRTIHGQTLMKWHQCGIRRCLFLRESPAVGVGPRSSALVKAIDNRLLARFHRVSDKLSVNQCQSFLQSVAGDHAPANRAPQRITHVIDTLGGGGAERQLCNVALAQKEDGLDVRVIVTILSANHDFHSTTLQLAGIPVTVMGARFDPDFERVWSENKLPLKPFRMLPVDLRDLVLNLIAELRLDKPDLLHCWIDQSNVMGMIAGHVLGIPRVIASLRSVRTFKEPLWMHPWYQAGVQLPGVKIVANSQAGADAYEHWLEMPRASIAVSRNMFVPPPTPSSDEVMRFRDAHGLTSETPVIAGVFRLEVEKRPLWFLKVIQAVHQQRPDVRVVIAGNGTWRERMEAEIERLQLQDVVTLLGERKDVPVILSASDVMLLTSEREGTPNVALEAQEFGCVPVIADVGGAKEAIAPGVSGVLCPAHDMDCFVHGILDLLNDAERRASMSRAGKKFLAEHYHPRTNLDHMMTLYHDTDSTARRSA